MITTIEPKKLCGTVEAVASKSQAHRALFLAAVSDRPTRIFCNNISEDIEATLRAVGAMGAHVNREDGSILIDPVSSGSAERTLQRLDCGESGTTLRFILPMIGALNGIIEIRTHGRLMNRPIYGLTSELSRHGMSVDQTGISIEVIGRLTGGTFELPGNVSSQFISALLMALPLLDEPSELIIDGPVSSGAYVDMTLVMMERFGVSVQKEGDRYLIEPVERYRSPGEIIVEGDWSAAAFWVAADAIGSEINITGLNASSIQGDSDVRDLIDRIKAGNARIDIDAVPDLLPALAVVAAVTEGPTSFVNAARLRDKESDRLESTAAMIRALGGSCELTEDSLTVRGSANGRLNGGRVDAAGDHRIAMSAAVAASVCEGEVTITGAETAAKSYPRFWEDYETLGGSIRESFEETVKCRDF